MLVLATIPAAMMIAAGGVTSLLAAPTADEYVAQAVSLYEKGSYAKAVELLKKALALNPRHVRAYSWLGICYAKLGRTQDALAAFKKVVELDPGSEDARSARRWISRLQVQATRTPSGAGRPAPTTPAGPTFLVDVPAVTGVREGNRAQQVQLFGEVYRKAIIERRVWVHNAEWRVVHNLQRRFARFQASAGVADGSAPEFSARFEVRADGNVLATSQPKRVGDVPEQLNLDVTGVLQLELIVRGQDAYYREIAVVWADPKVLPGGASSSSPGAVAQQPVPASPPSPAPRIATPVPPVPTSVTTSSAVLVMPFADSAGTGRDAGVKLGSAIMEELFKLGKIETISQQRFAQAVGYGRYDPLDVAFARQTAQRLGAGLVILGIVDRFHVSTGMVELIIRVHYKDVFVSVSTFHVIDASTGARLLSDSARIGVRHTAAQPGQLPGDDDALRNATQRVAAEIVQKVALVWGRRTGEITVQVGEAVVASNVTRDAEFRLRPTGAGTTFPASAMQIVAYLSGTGARPGQRVEFVWFGPEGREYSRGTVEIPPEQPPDQPFAAHHVIRPPVGGTIPAGRWRVEIRMEGYLLRTLAFSVME